MLEEPRLQRCRGLPGGVLASDVIAGNGDEE